MKYLVIASIILLSGCANRDYELYLDAQKSISRDNTMNETARITALIEMSKNADPAIRATGIMLLQQLQAGSKNITIDPPKRNWLVF